MQEPIKATTLKLREMLRMLPAQHRLLKDSSSFVHYRVLDNLHSRVLFTEYEHDEHVESPPEGIQSFNRYACSGFLLPDGTARHANNMQNWRKSIFEYHGGWYITVLEHQVRSAYFDMSQELVINMASGLTDARLRSEVLVNLAKVINSPNFPRSYDDYLQFVHNQHQLGRASTRPQQDRPSIVYA